MSNQHTIVILTALPLEYEAVVDCLEPRPMVKKEIEKETGSIYEIEYVMPNETHCKVVVYRLSEKGNYNAIHETLQAIEKFSPTYMFFVGIACGLKDVQFGDVVVADSVDDYESGKKEEKGWEARGTKKHSSPDLKKLAETVVADPQRLKEFCRDQQHPCKVLVGPIISGEKLVAAQDFLKKLQKTYPDALATEMEGFGFLKALDGKARIVEGIVIRGISDYGIDQAKAKAQGKREIAARHAAAFAFVMLDELFSKQQQQSYAMPDKLPNKQQQQPSTPIWTSFYIGLPMLPFMFESLIRLVSFGQFTFDTFNITTLVATVGFICLFVHQTLVCHCSLENEKPCERPGGVIMVFFVFAVFCLLFFTLMVVLTTNSPKIRVDQEVQDFFKSLVLVFSLLPITAAIMAQRTYKLKVKI